MNEGLIMVAIVTERTKFSLLDNELTAPSVFCILADVNDKIIHISESCVKVFKMAHRVMTNDIVIQDMIPDLPDGL